MNGLESICLKYIFQSLEIECRNAKYVYLLNTIECSSFIFFLIYKTGGFTFTRSKAAGNRTVDLI